MSDNNKKKPVNINISSAIEKLIDKLSNATGLIYAPYHKVKMAKAEVKAKEIKTLGDTKLKKLKQRTMVRSIKQEARKQQNMESIAKQATEKIEDNAQPEKMENDWVSACFNYCQHISDKDMQQLWSSILAEEANQPGTFTKHTLSVVATLEKREAEQFTNLCSFSIEGEKIFLPLIYKIDDEIYSKAGLSFTTLFNLNDIGLINFNHIQNFHLIDYPSVADAYYCGTLIRFRHTRDAFNAGSVKLTEAGQQLVGICQPKPNIEFLNNYLPAQLKEQGITMEILSEQNVKPNPYFF